MNDPESPNRIRRLREDLGPRVPYYMRSTQCEYVPLSLIPPIPEGVPVNCKWGNTYERAYRTNNEWNLVWDDRPMPTPDGVQVRRGLYQKEK